MEGNRQKSVESFNGVFQFPCRDLFNVIYGSKIVQDFKEGKLDRNGDPLEPSPMEQLSPEEALRLSRQTGSDVFSGGKEPSKTWNLDWKIGKTNN